MVTIKSNSRTSKKHVVETGTLSAVFLTPSALVLTVGSGDGALTIRVDGADLNSLLWKFKHVGF